MTNELREKTSDWILTEGYVQDDEPIVPLTVAEFVEEMRIVKQALCQHGIYKLTKPHTIICSICEQVIMPPKQVEEISDWINDLCRGA